MQTRIADLTHVGTLALGRMHAALFELMRGDQARAAPNAFELARLAREHDLPMWRAFGVFLEGWATAASGAPGGGLEDMRRGVELLREQNVLVVRRAIEDRAGRGRGPGRRSRPRRRDPRRRAGDVRPHRLSRIRSRTASGARRNAAEARSRQPRPGRGAFQTAIAVAKQQGTRSFELRAALSLAKLYQSTGRPADAHAVLAPALEGFAPTPEMPEIAEAQALLAALTQAGEVKPPGGSD